MGRNLEELPSVCFEKTHLETERYLDFLVQVPASGQPARLGFGVDGCLWSPVTWAMHPLAAALN